MREEEYYDTLLLCSGFTQEQINDMSDEDKEMNLGMLYNAIHCAFFKTR